jgi:hypothetical protein
MALPKLDAVRYTTELPVSKQKVDYRPFLVKEQKILLIAMESEDDTTIQTSILDLLQACVYNNEDIKLNTLPMADVEYLFLQIRIKSAGETADILLGCDCHEEVQTPITVDLRNAALNRTEVNNNINITDTIGIILTYPSLSSVKNVSGDINTNEMFSMIEACIESIYDGDEVHTKDDFDSKELKEFIESLTTDQFEKVQKFFEDMPKLVNKITYNCIECDKYHERDLEGISDFFG